MAETFFAFLTIDPTEVNCKKCAQYKIIFPTPTMDVESLVAVIAASTAALTCLYAGYIKNKKRRARKVDGRT